MTVTPAPTVPSGSSFSRAGGRAGRTRERPPAGVSPTAGYYFVALYVGLLLLLGVAPAAYAIYLSLAANAGGGFASAFHMAFTDYRFWPAFGHIMEFMAIWLVSQTVFVVGLVLMMHNMAQRVGSVFRFLFYIPGVAAAQRNASVIVLAVHARSDGQPVRIRSALAGLRGVRQRTIAPGNLPAVFAGDGVSGQVRADGSW